MARRRKIAVDWHRVREIKIASKSGRRAPDQAELRMLEAAIAEDPERYADLEEEVFYATAPFGSNLRRPRR